MSEMICQTVALSKVYKQGEILKQVNVHLKRGDIYGLIGENGAGKSTLIKLITGLVFATNGEIHLFGKSDAIGLAKGRSKMGAVIEAPALYLEMTARQNLEVHRQRQGIPGTSCIDDVLSMVNLLQTGRKKVKHFSLGMKQRLGIAIALLGEPELLILDEPLNGLDPTGMIELRILLKELNEKKRTTILISSHLLSELHQLATCYGIIHQGQLIEELSAEVLDQKCRKHLYLNVDEAKDAVCLLEEVLGIEHYDVVSNQEIRIYEKLDQGARINQVLASHSIYAKEITIKGDTLEHYFTKAIGGRINA